jgi:hypothetical protein
MRSLTGLGTTILLQTAFVIGWLLAELGLLSIPLLIKMSIPRRNGQLFLALGSTSHIVQLHLVILVRGLLFL